MPQADLTLERTRGIEVQAQVRRDRLTGLDRNAPAPIEERNLVVVEPDVAAIFIWMSGCGSLTVNATVTFSNDELASGNNGGV